MKSHHQPARTNLSWLNPLFAGRKDHDTPHLLMGERLCEQINKSAMNTCKTKDNNTIYKQIIYKYLLFLTLSKSLGMYQRG